MSEVLLIFPEADELCFIKSMHTEAINHDPAITARRGISWPAGELGAWLSYGLGTENKDLPLRRDDLLGRAGPTTNLSTTACGERFFAHSAPRREVQKFR